MAQPRHIGYICTCPLTVLARMRDIRRIDLNLLVALHALLEEGSVTRAADRLALTQPTVSAMLARLRKLLDDPLFVRAQRGIIPTPRARALAPALREWLTEASRLVAGECFDPATAQLVATVSANDYVQSALIVPFVQVLRRQAPNGRLAVRSPAGANAAAMLAGGELDVAITTSDEHVPADLPSRVLYEERYVCAVRREHPLRGRSITVEQFCRFPHVLISPTDGGFIGPTDLALSRCGAQRRVALSVPSFLILPEILKGDDLVAVVPERFLRGRRTGLRTFAPPIDVPGFSVIALWHRRSDNDPAHRWLRELLASIAKEIGATPEASR